MSTRIVEAAHVAGAAPLRRSPLTFSVGWSVALVVIDMAMFLTSSYFAAVVGLVGFHHWASPFAEKRLIIAQGIYVCAWLLIFERLGLYRRSFALSVKDELYYTSTALVLGTVPQLLLFTIVPAISTSRTVIALSLPFSIILVGLARAAAHEVRFSPLMHRGRRLVVAGRPERAASAYEALQLEHSDKALLLAVDDIDTAQGNPVDMEWFREACRWGCDTLILTEMLPPAVMLQFVNAASPG